MPTPFQNYTLHYRSGGNTAALIQLFNAGRHMGDITFHPEGATLPPNVLHPAGLHEIHYHVSRFRDVLQILQFEKPLQVHVTPSGIGSLMATGFEPVGEQEGH